MNSFLKLGLIAATALSVFAGCAADAEEPSASESDVISRGRPGFGEGAAEGEACGFGISGIEVKCADRLECKYPETKPGAADVMGTCAKKLGGDGDSCGRGLPQCAPTFICVTAPDDRGGHCEPTAFGG